MRGSGTVHTISQFQLIWFEIRSRPFDSKVLSRNIYNDMIVIKFLVNDTQPLKAVVDCVVL